MIICDNMDEMNDDGYYDEDNELLKLQFEKLWVEYHVVTTGPGDGLDANGMLDHRCLPLSDKPGPDRNASHQTRSLRSFIRCVASMWQLLSLLAYPNAYY